MVIVIGCLLYWKARRPTINGRGRRTDDVGADTGFLGDTMSKPVNEKSQFRKAMQDVTQLADEPRVEHEKPKPKATARFTRSDNAEVMRQSLSGSPSSLRFQTGGRYR